MKIEVTQKHIDKGTRGSSCHCPVALAIKDATSAFSKVNVGLFTALLNGRQWVLPVEVKAFVKAYDNEHPVQPFTFDLPIEEATTL